MGGGVRMQETMEMHIFLIRGRPLPPQSARTVSEREEQRRDRMDEDLNSASGIRRVAFQWGIPIAKSGYVSHIVREHITRCGCPENMRMELLDEFITRESRLPEREGVETSLNWYVESALSRRYLSIAEDGKGGEQLSADEVARWEGLFAKLPLDRRPVWKEDPLIEAARSVF